MIGPRWTWRGWSRTADGRSARKGGYPTGSGEWRESMQHGEVTHETKTVVVHSRDLRFTHGRNGHADPGGTDAASDTGGDVQDRDRRPDPGSHEPEHLRSRCEPVGYRHSPAHLRVLLLLQPADRGIHPLAGRELQVQPGLFQHDGEAARRRHLE